MLVSARSHDRGLDPAVRKEALLSQCEERLDRAWASSRPKTISSAIETHSCTAIKGGRSCAKCRICPNEEQWEQIQGYYRPNKSKIFICAEKEPSLEQVEATLSHELIHAFDHCRMGMRGECSRRSELSYVHVFASHRGCPPSRELSPAQY